MKCEVRRCRPPASHLFALSRSVSRKSQTVPPGTTAYAFVALHAPRLSSVQRHHSSLLRSVELRWVASAYRDSPRNTLQRVLTISKRTARRKKSARISERFAEKSEAGGPANRFRQGLRCAVASDEGQWRSLSEAIDQVLVSLTCAASAPGEAAADDDASDR